jgi:hypothetical protein
MIPSDRTSESDMDSDDLSLLDEVDNALFEQLCKFILDNIHKMNLYK